MQNLAAAVKMDLSPNIQKLLGKILHDNPLHRSILTAAVSRWTPEEAAELDNYLDYCIKKGVTIDYLADSYLVVVGDTLREQIYFQKHKKYRYSTFDEVANDVYFNKEYMSHYMYGIALTTYLWANHLSMWRFFNETLPRNKKGKYLEIGPGHGCFFTTAIDESAFDSFLGIDVSETSVQQTKELVEHRRRGKPARPYEIRNMDFLSADVPARGFDAVVMGEVLEHVERPDLLMKQIANVAKDDAYIYVSTCIDSPIVDHIYLFESTEEIEKLFNDCGLRIVKELFLPYEGTTLEQSKAKRLPISVVYVLQRK
jgi:2-polyprenyl-3-methyl-5-hydroxy-6-metoxy-1,4-benzoquinol methylase